MYRHYTRFLNEGLSVYPSISGQTFILWKNFKAMELHPRDYHTTSIIKLQGSQSVFLFNLLKNG